MNKETLLKYSTPLPRYTSYPTAPHFSPAVGSETYSGWLGSLRPSDSLSLYFHVPFCRSLCWFCGCHTSVARDPQITTAYAELLVRELRLLAKAMPAVVPVNHIHWGGGTPTSIGAAALCQVMEEASTRFGFAEDVEIAIEIDPRTLMPDMARTLGMLGFNRVSLGVQDLDPTVQAAVNRIQPLGITRAAAEALRDAGIQRFNVDLMVGLPKQTEEGVRRSVSAVIDRLSPDRVSVFAYAHVPWMKRHQRLIDEAALPDALARLSQVGIAAETIIAQRYVAIGLDHFACAEDSLAKASQAGRLRRNFQGYTVDQASVLIGLGASAIGSLPQAYVQNTLKVADYRRAIESGIFAVVRGFELTDADRLRRDVIERLMCDLNVDLDDAARRWGASPRDFDDAVAALKPLSEDGLVNLSGSRIEVPADARPVIRSVCAVFDSYPRA